jgi:uncharacterized protein (TIGR02284 family)
MNDLFNYLDNLNELTINLFIELNICLRITKQAKDPLIINFFTKRGKEIKNNLRELCKIISKIVTKHESYKACKKEFYKRWAHINILLISNDNLKLLEYIQEHEKLIMNSYLTFYKHDIPNNIREVIIQQMDELDKSIKYLKILNSHVDLLVN